MKANLCGKHIKIARVSHEMHQVDLAAALCVDYNLEINQSMISAIERGHQKISHIELDAIAKVLGISVIWLLYGDKGEPGS